MRRASRETLPAGLEWRRFSPGGPLETDNVHAAKTHLSRLIEEAAAGEEVVIARAGKPVARLLPFEARAAPRRPGLMKGEIWSADHFDDPLPEESMATFRGERP